MDVKKQKNFNRIEYLRECLAAFLQSETKGINLIKGKLNALNRVPVSINYEIDNRKRKVLEQLLENKKFAELLRREKEKNGILDQEFLSTENREENLRKIYELSQKLSSKLAEVIFSDGKRKYNMSSLSTSGIVSKEKPITFIAENGPAMNLTDILGSQISIQQIGRLHYHVGPILDNYIFKYRVSRHISKEEILIDEVFSNIDLNELEDNPDYADAVTNTLLTNNNIEFSQANGYIGEISEQSSLEPNTERLDSDLYTYQITPEYALIFDGEKIEAIKAYKEQEKNKDKDEER